MIFYWLITTASPHYLVICNQGEVTHMQPQRCLPCVHQLFVELHRKKILTSQNKSLMQWKQWIIQCKSWNLFFSPTLCGILKKYYWFIILWLHHLRQQETTNKTECKHHKLGSYLCQAALQVAALLLVLQRHFCFLRLQKHQCLLHKSNPHLWSVSGSLDCSPLINKKGPLD